MKLFVNRAAFYNRFPACYFISMSIERKPLKNKAVFTSICRITKTKKTKQDDSRLWYPHPSFPLHYSFDILLIQLCSKAPLVIISCLFNQEICCCRSPMTTQAKRSFLHLFWCGAKKREYPEDRLKVLRNHLLSLNAHILKHSHSQMISTYTLFIYYGAI